ncbi:MAG: DUF6033 family protein [Bacteroides sp.]|nr:DUF6033 family protein [Eubacterium sp.]MCM1419652.1 DUF6033 family protein [Roseburia sp.]MCM1463307.1 DUF6033 family protein [Bacteroides sp.]
MMNHVEAAGNRNTYPTPTKSPVREKEKETGGIRTAKTDAFERVGGSGLSEKAQALLKELQAKYGDTDFIIADYDSEEEANRLLSRGTKEYGVLIDPETLEKMAADESVRAEYEGYINDSREQLNAITEQLAEKGAPVQSVSAKVSGDGTMSFFAGLEEMTKARNERMEEAREKAKEETKKEEKLDEKREAKKAEEAKRVDETRHGRKPYEPPKLTFISADSADELLKKIFEFYGIDPTAEADEA